MAPHEWQGWPDVDDSVDFPPDLTPNSGPQCMKRHPHHSYRCTRRPGHGLRHAAGNGVYIVAVWS